MQEIDQRDRELLGALQSEIPLVSTPFALVGQAIDMSEKEVLKRIERLKREGLLRHLAAQFDARALGYRSCLVAAKVDPERIDDAAASINAHPGVTQNYRRNNDFNLWFTIAVSPSSLLGLNRTIDILGDEAGCETVRALPTLRQFKGSSDVDESQSDAHFAPLTLLEIESVRLLQRDLPVQPRPFEALAKTNGIAADDLLATAKSLLKRGYIRRYSAVVQTRKPGIGASAMGVWIVPANAVEGAGTKMSQNKAVSHCYLRPVYDDWPYNLYTIVHGRSVDECESIINDLAIDSGVEVRQALYPTREYKKARINLFSAEAEEWESAHGASQVASAAS
ncbi:MAG: siroheme decarboxylase [Thermoanaerobaculia bacterium]|jgi:DNA-binding Lrp family transcriptional regulator|nr:siroheme decarboxylase [Thermoanaerobaculia bacterium]